MQQLIKIEFVDTLKVDEYALRIDFDDSFINNRFEFCKSFRSIPSTINRVTLRTNQY